MSVRIARRRRARGPVLFGTVLLAATLLVTGCGGGKDAVVTGSTSPADALAAAKKNFDDASSVHFTMSTDSTPKSGDAVLGAEGTLTHQPAFDGRVKAQYKGFVAEIPVVSVDGKVHAKLPLAGFAVIDPAQFSAPDPADFVDPDAGISGLLLRIEDVKKAGRKREGKAIVNTYAGTLAGSLVAPIIPSASDSGTYKTVVGIDEDGRIATLSVTGEFFAADGPVTYDLTFGDYDKDVTVKAP